MVPAVASGKAVGERVNAAAGLTVREICLFTVCGVWSITVKVGVNVPDCEGVPEMTPVVVLIDRPVGKPVALNW